MDNPVKKLRGSVVELCATGRGSIINIAEGK
jgi:hypothetical protein